MKKKPLHDYTLFAEAWILLAFARFMLLFVPFRMIAKLLGKAMYEPPEGYGKDTAIQNRISEAIRRACSRSPWRTKCFEQAIAAKIMLKARSLPGTVYFGVNKKTPGKMEAHAWVKSNSLIVTGAAGVERFTVVSWFGS